MLIRFLSIVVAFGLLGFAVFRLADVQLRKSQQSPSDEKGNFPKRSLRWLSRTKVLVAEDEFPPEARPIKRGDSLFLFQSVKTGERCLLAVFRVNQMREQLVTLDALGRVPNSRLRIWADALNLPTTWSWIPVRGDKSQQKFVQRCHEWIKLPGSEPVVHQRVRSQRFFIRGSQYSEIRSYNKQQVRLEVDYFRHGWWVNPLVLHGPTELHARNATTGQLEKLILQFSFDRDSQTKKVSTRAGREPIKSFALPGWE